MKQSLFTIQSNEQLAEGVYKMVLAGDTSAITAPGQFVNIRLNSFFLRRPISVCDYGKQPDNHLQNSRQRYGSYAPHESPA